MMMDKGLGLRETENFIEASAHLTDLVKFGFGTSMVSKNLEEKIRLYQEAGLRPYLEGPYLKPSMQEIAWTII